MAEGAGRDRSSDGARAMTDKANGKKIGGPRLHAPADAPMLIENAAANGASMVGVAAAVGCSVRTLEKWIDEDSALAEAFARGRECERQVLHNVLYRIATEGKDDRDRATAAIMILNARHGYRREDQSDGNRISITFALPGALTLDEFKKAQQEFAKLQLVVNAGNSANPVSAPRLSRT